MRATSGRYWPRRTPRTGAETPGIVAFCVARRALLKSSTRRSGFCIREAWTSRGPWPSTRTLSRCEAAVTATLEITEAVADAPPGSCVCANDGLTESAAAAIVRQPIRKAGRFVFIAVLLHWRRFFFVLGVLRAFRTRPYPTHGTKLRPWQSCQRDRHKAGRLRAGSRCAIADSRRRRSCPPKSERCHRAGAC